MIIILLNVVWSIELINSLAIIQDKVETKTNLSRSILIRTIKIIRDS